MIFYSAQRKVGQEEMSYVKQTLQFFRRFSRSKQRAPQPNEGLTLASKFDPAGCKLILGTATEFSLIQ